MMGKSRSLILKKDIYLQVLPVGLIVLKIFSSIEVEVKRMEVV